MTSLVLFCQRSMSYLIVIFETFQKAFYTRLGYNIFHCSKITAEWLNMVCSKIVKGKNAPGKKEIDKNAQSKMPEIKIEAD